MSEWRCFFCNEVFTTLESAMEHFGRNQQADPGCTIDLKKYREMEELTWQYQQEDTDLHRALHAAEARRIREVQKAEKQGYERGLADGMKHPTSAGEPK